MAADSAVAAAPLAGSRVLVAPSGITLMPRPLWLCALTKESDQRVADGLLRPLLRLLFFPPSNDAFFSLCENEDELSLIIDDASLPHFPSDAVASAPSAFAGLRILEGEAALGAVGVVHRLTRPLAALQCGLLYVSTWATDLVLVDAAHRDAAHGLLRRAAADFADEGAAAAVTASASASASTSASASADTVAPPSSAATASSEAADDGLAAAGGSGKRMMTISVNALPNRLGLCYTSRSNLPAVTHQLLQLLLFVERPGRFLSVTSSAGDDITVVADRDDLAALGMDRAPWALNEQSWVVIQLTGEDPSATGAQSLVSIVSDVLSRASVSLFYLQTFTHDFTLVGEQQLEKSLAALRSEFRVLA